MAHLIYSRRADNSIMSSFDIASRAPAVFSSTKADRLSDRYASLHTSDLIPVMQDYGYHVTQAAQRRSRKSTADHAAHLLAFSKAGDIEGADGMRPEIVLYNSHDGTSSVKMFAGLFRFVCSNGIVAGDGFSAKLHHTNSAMRGFEDMLRGVVESMPKLMDTIEALRSKTLDINEMATLARKAVALRWDYHENMSEVEKPGVFADSYTASTALQSKRYEDNGADAWTVLNKVQENVLRGGLMIKSLTQDGTVHLRKARAVNSVAEHVRINSALFDLVEV